jgi:hypothetical protein
VWNTPIDAAHSLEKLKSIIENRYEEKSITYKVFYNDTGSNHDASSLEDIAETFIQRANEIDTTGSLGQRIELIWDIIDAQDNSLLRKIFSSIPSLIDTTIKKFYESIAVDFAAAIAKAISNPPTEENYSVQEQMADKIIENHDKFIMIAHSQGNLFLNHIFDYVKDKMDENTYTALHIAPASPTLRGDYMLSDNDFVINALRLQGAGTVPANNLSIPFSLSDPTGHTLITSYLKSGQIGESIFLSIIQNVFSKFQSLAQEKDKFKNKSVFDVLIEPLNVHYPITHNMVFLWYKDPHGTANKSDLFVVESFMCLKNDLTLGQTDVEEGIYQFSYTNEFIPSQEENWRIPSFNEMDVSIWQSGSKIWKKTNVSLPFPSSWNNASPKQYPLFKIQIEKNTKEKNEYLWKIL